MEAISYGSLVWLSYRLGATFALGLPLVLFIWASVKKESSILRLLSIYWKVASLMVIGMLPIVGSPLPIMSYGGSSMLSIMLGLSIVMSCKIYSQDQITNY